jgi:hypothetical protein
LQWVERDVLPSMLVEVKGWFATRGAFRLFCM